MAPVTPEPTPEFAAAASEVLVQLAGPSAQLRDDQLLAIDALH